MHNIGNILYFIFDNSINLYICKYVHIFQLGWQVSGQPHLPLQT